MATAKGIKIIIDNRKARYDFFIHETIEAGIVLTGTEVKSLRQGRANLKDSYAQGTREGEMILYNLHISPYEQGNIFNTDPLRKRKLLLHKAEIIKLMSKVNEKGYTLIPLKLYFKDGKVKVDLALASGKKLYDKRRTIAEKDSKREMDRALKEKQM